MYRTYIYDRISHPNYIKKLKDKKGPAKKGDSSAQIEYATACLYGIKNNGKDVFKQDLKLAMKYVNHLVGIEHADGLVLFGIMQLTGTGAFKDIPSAFNSFYRAINKDPNNKDAKFLISHIFFNEDFKEVSSSTAIDFLIQSGENDEHSIKQAMGELGILYYKGVHVEKNYELALKFLIISSITYLPANKALKECTGELTNKEFCLEHFSRPKSIYKAALLIRSQNQNKITGVVDQLLKWADSKDYPPAMYDYSYEHMNQNKKYYESRMSKAAEKMHVLSIVYCASYLTMTKKDIMKLAKESIYFKSLIHMTTIAHLYKETSSPSSFNLGIYFRYMQNVVQFNKEDQQLIRQLKLKAWKDGSNEEKYAYAICLENGFNGLKKDVETAVYIYKNLSENGYDPATRNFAHFQEFAEFVHQDLPSAIKKLEQYDDLEAKTTIEMMNTMIGDHPILPFPYSHKYNKAKGGISKDPSKKYTKIAFMLIRNKEMIPNFKLAEKILGKAKGKSPLGTAIMASICGDSRAGKPNPSKAEKMFQEALKESSEPEIKELYADFLIAEDREEEAKKLNVGIKSTISFKPRRSTLSLLKNFSTKDLKTAAQLTDGKELYYEGYLKNNNDKRFLERSAAAGFPLAQSEYAHLIIKEGKKKEYKKALSYLNSSANAGIITSYVLLGYMHHKGLDCKPNFQEAIKNYSIAIENLEYQGYAGFALAYCTGNGFDRDFYMANRYIKIAQETNTTFDKPYLIDYQLFVNKDLKSKFDDIKEKDVSKLNTSKASNAFTCATYYEFVEKKYQKAFVHYKKAFDLEPDNPKYKRNYAYFILKNIGVKDNFDEAAKYYNELGNADDLINLKIANHYIEHPAVPFYMNENIAKMIDNIANDQETLKDYYDLGCSILNSNKVHQQYGLAISFLHSGAQKYDDPNSYYLVAQMAENGFGGSFSNDEILKFYASSALINNENEMFVADNAKGCYKLGTMLANGDKVYTDLHQACFYLLKAIQLKLENPNIHKEYNNILETLITNKKVIDPYDEHLADFYYIKKINEDEFDELKITDLSNPYQNWKTYDPSLDNSNDPNVLFQRGFQYMKGVGIAKDYNKALSYLAKAVIQNHSQAKVYFAILSKMCNLSHCSELFKFNMLGAKIQGLSLAYVEEAKIELGLYENIPKGDVNKAQELLQIAIDAGDSYALYIRGRYLEDAHSLREASNKGCGKASYYIGKMMIDEHQYDDALPIIERGASQGHPKAVFIYGYLNMLQKNKEKAEEFLTKGVNMAGNSIIAVKYGLERLKGSVISRKEAEAYKWFEFAHNMNNLDGTLNLAICLRDGIGCTQDRKKASLLFKIGCKLKIPEFYSPASQCFGDMKGVKNWFKEKKYGKKARKNKAAPPQFPDRIIKPSFQIDSNSVYNPRNAFNLARKSKGNDINSYKQHLQTATKLGLFGAVKETIYQLISGFYLDQNEDLAYSLVNQLIAAGWATGYKILGDIYFAKEIFYNKSKTFEAYKKAYQMGSKSGAFKYGYCLVNGIGCDKNVDEGCSIIDSSNCKYAYDYLKTYTNYKPKISKQNTNCITILHKVASLNVTLNYKVKQSYYDPKKSKKDSPLVTLEDLQILIEKDIKYGVIMYNKYCWDNNISNKINATSMKPLQAIAIMGSSFANYQYGYTLYNRRELADCIKYLKYAADRDNYSACHFVGRALYDDSIKQYSLAKVYLTKSAIQLNDADDQYDLAFLSENKEASEWLEMAAKNDSDKYGLKVADLFRNGIRGGLEPNPQKAAHYYEEIRCKVKNADDYLRIGRYFRNGDGVPKNYRLAYYYFQDAADYGSNDGAGLVCLMYEKNEFGSSFPEKYYIMAANANQDYSPHFCWNLAVHYYQNASSTSTYDHKRAADYFEKCGTSEALEIARKIREAVAEYERQRELERQRQQAQNNNDNNSGGGLLLALGVGVMLVTGLPLV